jgi:hypothetical protein
MGTKRRLACAGDGRCLQDTVPLEGYINMYDETQWTRHKLTKRLYWLCMAVLIAVIGLVLNTGRSAQAQDPCTQPVLNPIVCENSKPGNPLSEWDIVGAGDPSIQGFATQISVNRGETIHFKIDTDATNYRLDIYRMGYYSGKGARKVTTIGPSVALPQNQPTCLTDDTTGLIDCGNWAESASWTVPSDATSGIYFAKLVRQDGVSGASHIVFVVRDDSGHSDILFQTSDTTWQAYNSYGGNSLYIGSPGSNPGRAYKVSYNRPFNTREQTPEDWMFYAEYPMVRWLEANGYKVSYFTGVDSDRRGAELLEHKLFLSVGHDEYWSAAQRTNVEAARAAGKHLAFLSGNEVFWKTRWENSMDGSSTPYRTLVTYKETHANAKIDPLSNVWTGTWRDPRFSPPADGNRPENALTGTIFMVNCCYFTAMEVPAADGKMRFWRNTSVATLAPGQTATLADGTIGYEWDEDRDNGFRPAGLIRLSSTTVDVGSYLLDYGSTYGSGTATHRLTLYRYSSGALVFGAGTTQWPWGLDGQHDDYPLFNGVTIPDVRMQQATINLFADMGVQPGTLQSGLVPATASTDTTAPTSIITSPAAGSTVHGSMTITGTATDTGGGVVGGVEVSVDGGTTWHPATGRENWSYNWQPSALGAATIKSRAVDDSGNLQNPPYSITVSVQQQTCPCSIWNNTTTPAIAQEPDKQPIEVGVKFQANVNGYITGIRFYKGAGNTGTHVGHLWTSSGTQLATATFTNETATGWQQANLSTAVAITANTTYVVSYYAPVGGYSVDQSYFTAAFVNTPLQALADGAAGGNGVYNYGASGFPTDTFNASNYWIDVVFTTTPPPADTTPPTVSSESFPNGTTGVSPGANVTATFSEDMNPTTINTTTVKLHLGTASGAVVAATVTYDAATKTVLIDPTATLAYSTTYTVTLQGGSSGVKDAAGNALSTTFSWSFTTAPAPVCPCSIWNNATVPAVEEEADTQSIEVGVKFRTEINGSITGIRFYKGAGNTGTHVGHLWTSSGALLATVTFTNETATGWQQANMSTPVGVTANTTYIVSYYAPVGKYALNESYFTTAVVKAPLRALADGEDGSNGIYKYGASGFPTQAFSATNYWVDVVFSTSPPPPDTTPPTISGVLPASGATGVVTGSTVRGTFSELMNATTITTSNFSLRNAANQLVAADVSYDSLTSTATLTPSSPLVKQTTYTATIKGGSTGVKDVAGNALAANFIWSFTTGIPPDDGPGGPILIITDSADPFSRYYAEILHTEGFNAFAVSNISTVTATTLTSYDVVILDVRSLTSAQVTMLTNWVNAGGNLIAMRPDIKLASLLGLTSASSTLASGYLLVNTATAPGAGIVNQTIQFRGPADLYTLNGASSIATLYSNASTATPYPAVTLRSVGTNGGQAAAFTYSLARSVSAMRQGNVGWSGQERDGIAPMRSDDLFFGNATADPQPDWIDFNKVAIPQADEQQRLLANLMLHMNLDKKPLPRFWYFPRGMQAVVVMTGDDHATGGTAGRFDQYMASSPSGCSVANWECIRGTSYIYPGSPLTNAEAAFYNANGFEVALHVSTGCADWTPASLETFYSDQLSSFAADYPSVSPPTTNRTHCIVWSDYVTQAKVELAHGIRLDTTYYFYPASWVLDRPGFFTSSGMPMRFADLDGTMIDVYQAATQMTDESGQTYPFVINTLLDRALGPEGYYGAFTANLHTDQVASSQSDAVVAAALARGVPIVSAQQMLTWLDGRNNSTFSSFSWSANTLSFTMTVGQGANGLEAMVPVPSAAGILTSIKRNGSPITYTTKVIKGIEYAAFPATNGAYTATYATSSDTTPPIVSNVSPANGATAIATATSVTATFSEAMEVATINPNSFELRDPTNTWVAAVVSYNAGTRTATLTPNSPLASGTTYRATVKGGSAGVKDVAGNALSTDFTWTFTTSAAPPCPCSIWTNTTTPAVAATSDTQSIELGLKFQASVNGYITGIRFYKGTGNTGAHVGHLWTSSGTLLANVSFSSETATGWQQATLAPPVAITANTTYVVSYYAPVGQYAFSASYFAAPVAKPPLQALSDEAAGGNGVYKYGASGFPTQTFNAGNYWVDVVFNTVVSPDTTPPTVSEMSPAGGATGVPTGTTVQATFSEAMDASTVNTVSFELRAANTLVAAAMSYDSGTATATLIPSSPLVRGTTYTATVKGGTAGVKDVAGNALASDVSWSFTTAAQFQCPCSLWSNTTTPTVEAVPDASAVELGMKFRAEVDGFITGLRFYKGAGNNGPHVGNLWTSSGALLGSVSFANETATGWQQVNFSTPIPITANTTYVVSYHTPSGFYAFDPQYFSAAFTHSPLRALANGEEGGNDVYQYGASSFPNQTYNATNYWVDVVFTTP